MATSSSTAPVVLFDLDGTITDSGPGVVGSFRAALERHGVPVPDGDLSTRVVGPPMSATMASLGVGAALERTLLADYRADYAASGWRDSEVFAGMGDLIARLAADSVRLAVTTSKQETDARRILGMLGLSRYFEVIAGAHGERHTKADVIAHALAALGLGGPAAAAGQRTVGAPVVVLVGDRSHDVHGGAAHGIPVAFVEWGYGTAAEAEGAAWVVRTPEDLGGTLLRYLERKRAAADGAAAPADGGEDGPGTVHVTFVCTGNICRSPMAEKIVGEHLRRAGLSDRVRVTSAGTGDWHVGAAADPRARAELLAHGYPVDHTAAQVGPGHLAADLIVALDSGHRRALLAAGADPARVRMLRGFDPHADGTDVADPYYGADDGFTTVRGQIEAAAPGIVGHVRDLVGSARAHSPLTSVKDRP